MGLHCSEKFGSRRDMTLRMVSRLNTSCQSSLERRSEACCGVQEVKEEPEVGVVIVNFIDFPKQRLDICSCTIFLCCLLKFLLGQVQGRRTLRITW